MISIVSSLINIPPYDTYITIIVEHTLYFTLFWVGNKSLLYLVF